MKYRYLPIVSALWLISAAPATARDVHPTLSPETAIALSAAVEAVDTDRVIPAFITIDPGVIDRDALTAIGVNVTMEAGDVLTARVPLNVIGDLSSIEGVRYVQMAAGVTQQLDKAIPETGADAVRTGSGLPSPFTGDGVVIGVVDAGFDYNHAAFRDKDGNLRIKRVWEQPTPPTGNFRSPEKYGYGVELSTPEEIIAAEGDIRNNTHGTHVTGIAAGSDLGFDGIFRGAAPDADIVLVSMSSDSDGNVAIAEGVAYIFDYASSVGKPCVVNLSLGTHAGPHDGTSSFDRFIDSLQGPGRLIVGSAGNDRASRFHLTADFASAQDSPLRTFIDYRKSVNAANVGGNIEVWGSRDKEMEVALTAVNTRTGEIAERVVIYPADQASSTVSLGRNITGSFSVAIEDANPANGKPHVVMTSGVTAIRNNYAIAIEVTPKAPGQVDIWADNVHMGLSGKGVDGYSDANGSTIAELGGTSRRILTVGSYTTRNTYVLYDQTTENTLDETIGQISSFSNYGPTADGRMKPQVTAPGCYIISAVSANAVSVTPLSHSYEKDGRWMSYGYMQGTSMSSPLVAGVVATWLQAWPELTPEQLAAIVSTTSRSDSYTGDLSEGSNDWGWGKIDALAGIRECIRLSGIESIGSDISTGDIITIDGDNLNLIFGHRARSASIDIYNTMGATVMHRDLGPVSSGSDYSLSLSSLPLGIYIVSLSTPVSSSTLKIVR